MDHAKRASETRSPLTVRVATAATILMGLGIGILFLSHRRQHWSLPLGLWAMGLALLLVAFVIATEGYRMWRVHRAESAGQPKGMSSLVWNLPVVPRVVGGEVFIEVDAEQRKAVRKWLVFWGIYLILIAVALPVGMSLGSAGSAKRHAVRGLLLYAYGPMTALLAVAGSIDGLRRWRSLRQRIGTDGHALLYDDGTGEVRRYEWDTVLVRRRSLLAGGTVIALYSGHQYSAKPMFAVNELREVVLARLPRSAFVGDWRFLWSALRQGSGAVLWRCVTLALLLSVLLLSELRPDLISALKAAYQAFLKSKMS